MKRIGVGIGFDPDCDCDPDPEGWWEWMQGLFSEQTRVPGAWGLSTLFHEYGHVFLRDTDEHRQTDPELVAS
jgi:hypothetical protein